LKASIAGAGTVVLALVLGSGLPASSPAGAGTNSAGGDEDPGTNVAGVPSPGAPAAPLRILDWGPRSTRAGIPFNVQPGGHAGVWLRLNQPLKGRVVLVQYGDAFLEGQVAGPMVTAIVPEPAYARRGAREVRAIARFGDAHWGSDPVSFSVE
jgi:hypothetical protein